MDYIFLNQETIGTGNEVTLPLEFILITPAKAT